MGRVLGNEEAQWWQEDAKRLNALAARARGMGAVDVGGTPPLTPMGLVADDGGASFSWTPYKGEHGGKGWKNTGTGEVRYQEKKPTEREGASDGGGASPGPAPAAPKNEEGGETSEMLTRLKDAGGFSFLEGSHKFKEMGTDGYSVSPYPARSRVYERPITQADIRSFHKLNHELLAQPNHGVGAWFDPESKKTFLDIVVLMKGESRAKQLGEEHNQISIFEFKNGRTIPTGGTGDIFPPPGKGESHPDRPERLGRGDRSNPEEFVRGVEYASPDIWRKAINFATEKVYAAPVPSSEDIDKARRDLRSGGRPGGESRGGSAQARRKQRENLFNQFGGEEQGYCVCHGCGRKLHFNPAPGSEMERLERGKIFVKCQGGGYQLPNLLPECFACNRGRNDTPIRKEIEC